MIIDVIILEQHAGVTHTVLICIKWFNIVPEFMRIRPGIVLFFLNTPDLYVINRYSTWFRVCPEALVNHITVSLCTFML